MQLHNITQHYMITLTIHYHYNCNYNYHYIVLHYANHTTPQLQLQLRYTNPPTPADSRGSASEKRLQATSVVQCK